MERPVSPYRRIIWRFVGACVLPVALWSAYLYFSGRSPEASTTTNYFAALSIPAGAGLPFVATLRVQLGDRIFYSIIYVLTMGIALFMYSVYFAGLVFGDWL